MFRRDEVEPEQTEPAPPTYEEYARLLKELLAKDEQIDALRRLLREGESVRRRRFECGEMTARESAEYQGFGPRTR